MGRKTKRGKIETEQAREYLTAMKADGWTCEPTYSENDPHYSLEREGWEAMVNLRDPGTEPYLGRLRVWAPDKIAVTIPIPYSWERLNSSLRKCMYCKAEDVETTRIGLAGRCCMKCRKDKNLVGKIEYPGWTS